MDEFSLLQTPDMESFQLIVDSVEGLRELTRQFAEPEPIIIKRGKKEQVRGRAYSEAFKISNTFLFVFLSNMLVIE